MLLDGDDVIPVQRTKAVKRADLVRLEQSRDTAGELLHDLVLAGNHRWDVHLRVFGRNAMLTKNMSQICQDADILISAIGKPKFLGREYVKKDAIIVDVGYAINPITGKTSGDFDFDAIQDLVSYITPVPGGVGPMTVVSLLLNTVTIAKNSI